MAATANKGAVAVVGNGIIGHAMAEVFAGAGHHVVMIGRSDASLARAMGNIEASLGEFVANELLAATEALQPHLDARRDPPEEVGALVAAGHRGISSGRGVYDWTKRDGAALLAKRRAELFRWLKVDRDEAQ